MFAIRDDREYIIQEDLTKAARKVSEAKKHESQCHAFSSTRVILTSNNSEDGLQRQMIDAEEGNAPVKIYTIYNQSVLVQNQKRNRFLFFFFSFSSFSPLPVWFDATLVVDPAYELLCEIGCGFDDPSPILLLSGCCGGGARALGGGSFRKYVSS